MHRKGLEGYFFSKVDYCKLGVNISLWTQLAFEVCRCISLKFVLCVAMGIMGGGPRVVVSTAAFHARVRGSVPGLGGLKETKNCFFPIHV